MEEQAIYECFDLIASFSDYDSIVTLSSVSRSLRSRLRDLVRVGDPTTRRPLDVVTRLTPFLKKIRLCSRGTEPPVTVNKSLTSLTVTDSDIDDRLATCVPQLRELVLTNVDLVPVTRFWEVRTLHLERSDMLVDLGILFPRLERLTVVCCVRYTMIHTEQLEMLVVSDSAVAGWVNRIETLVCHSGVTALTTREIGLCVFHGRTLTLLSSFAMPNIIDCLATLHPRLSNPGCSWNTLVTSNHQLCIPLDMRPLEHRTTPRLVVMRINRSTRRKIYVILHCENSVLILDTGPKTVIAGMDLQGVWKVIFLGVNTPLSVPEGIRLITDECDDPHLRRYRELQERIAPYEKLQL